jgi:hypothetical protein
MKKYLTKKLSTTKTVRIDGTDAKIALPYSINWHSYYGHTTFDIGHVKFEVCKDRSEVYLRPLTDIPASWFVDLNAAPVEYSEAA